MGTMSDVGWGLFGLVLGGGVNRGGGNVENRLVGVQSDLGGGALNADENGDLCGCETIIIL
jgi:hypothetical protein